MLNRWFNSKKHTYGRATCDLRVGKNMTLDFQDKDGSVMRHYCQFSKIEPNRCLEFTWITDFCPYETKVVVDFIPMGDQSKIKISHTGFRTPDMTEAHTTGWKDCLDSIAEELAR